MSRELLILTGTAAALGLVHTVIGPDHYLPFIALAKARNWSHSRTIVITVLCGLGHILSSVVLGFAGIAVGMAMFRIESIESLRGDIAAWLLIIFGFSYGIWGLCRAARNKPHAHPHLHREGRPHVHDHGHGGDHAHVHGDEAAGLTPWLLFIVFVFGPCEPLIPLVMYPAATGHMQQAVFVACAFGAATILTMLGIVVASCHGLSRVPFGKLERYSHALAGLAIFLCGLGIRFLGL